MAETPARVRAFDEAVLRRFMAWLLARHAALGVLTEVRLLADGATWSGLFAPADLDGLCEALHPVPRTGPLDPTHTQPRSGEAGCYFGLQGVAADSAAARRMPRGRLTRMGKGEAVSDDDIGTYTLFPIDFDPVREPKGISANDAEKSAAFEAALAVRSWLDGRGVGSLLADSGNGYHLLVPLLTARGVEGGAKAKEAARGLLHWLHHGFGSTGVDVDRKNWNPSRIFKLYGTLSRKGEHTPERPHRLSSIDIVDPPGDVDLFALCADEVAEGLALEAEEKAAKKRAARGLPRPAAAPSKRSEVGARPALASDRGDVSPAPRPLVVTTGIWMEPADVATLAGIDVRNVQLAVKNTLQGKAWRGVKLEVREAKGEPEGGRSPWRILLSSLPPELQAKWRRPGEAEAPAPSTFDAWREEALARLDLEAVYGDYLTDGRERDGWLECRDPWSPSGKDSRSAGVADGTGQAVRGTWHSFRSDRTLNVFDFLIETGRCADFAAARRLVADLSGVPLPGRPALAVVPPVTPVAVPPAPIAPAVSPLDPTAAFAPDVEEPTEDEAPSEAADLLPVVLYVRNVDRLNTLFDNLISELLAMEHPRFFRQGSDLIYLREEGPSLVTERSFPGLLSSHLELQVAAEIKGQACGHHFTPLPVEKARSLLHNGRVLARLPELRLYTRSPLFTRQWRWIGTPGYHPQEGIYYAGPPVPPHPGDPQTLHRVLSGFAWKADADLHNFWAMLLTVVTLPHWTRGGKPLVVINGNKPGVGKTTLASILAWIAEGQAPRSVSYVSDDQEFEKILATEVEAGRRVLLVDNAKTRRPIESAVLERIITSDAINFRRLGSNTTITRPENDLLAALTMNLTQLGADLRRRSLPINLVLEEALAEREFPLRDVLAFVEAHRLQIVSELAGMVQAWLDAGRPMPEKPARHSVNRAWSETMDAILQAWGMTAFLSNLEESAHAMDARYDLMAEVCRKLRHRRGFAGEWVEWLSDAGLNDLFLDGGGRERTTRAKATAVGQLFTDYLDATLDLDDEGVWKPTRDYPRGPRSKPVYAFAEVSRG